MAESKHIEPNFNAFNFTFIETLEEKTPVWSTLSKYTVAHTKKNKPYVYMNLTSPIGSTVKCNFWNIANDLSLEYGNQYIFMGVEKNAYKEKISLNMNENSIIWGLFSLDLQHVIEQRQKTFYEKYVAEISPVKHCMLSTFFVHANMKCESMYF